ncbi:nicotinamide N-methyltransferase-like [Aquarana catesbeiana]|uniref:nicotinamide N-methyltransferase-like n=1 Tax=Aquarana catesbeiana TaxID=8400 RepID=UPI003CCA6DFA
MEPVSNKLYHVHGFHSRNLLDTYFSSKPEMPFTHEAFMYPMEKFHNAFSSGDFRGDVLIDISTGPIIHHLYAALKYFREIILLKPSDHCIVELKKWTDSRTGAFDWSHTSILATELAGESDQCEEKEIGLRAAIKHVVKFNLNQENLTGSIGLPQADCLVFCFILGSTSKDLEEFGRNFKKFSKLLKPGGRIMYYGILNCTFYMVGGEKFNHCKYNESDFRSVLSNEGFVITHLEVSQRKAESDLIDFDSVMFCTAYKEQKI